MLLMYKERSKNFGGMRKHVHIPSDFMISKEKARNFLFFSVFFLPGWMLFVVVASTF
jgi:hypothetical protein